MAMQFLAISFILVLVFVGLCEGGGLEWFSFEFGVFVVMLFLMMVFILFLYNVGIVSIYEYLECWFSVFMCLLLSVVFLISWAFVIGVMVYVVFIILESVLGVFFFIMFGIIGVIIFIYFLQGGMKVVVYGDMIQMIILFLGILLCMGFVLVEIGGWEVFIVQFDCDWLDVVDFFGWGFQKGEEFGFWLMLLGGFFLYVFYYGMDQLQVQCIFFVWDMGVV